MDINLLIEQIQNALTLYAEVLACIVAAGIFGWVVGLMMQRAKHKAHMRSTISEWEHRLAVMENEALVDSSHLEEQIQSLAKETRSLQATNVALSDTLKKNDTNTQKARAESIELNRQHSETHERLQRIIQQKDREIAELGSMINKGEAATRSRTSRPRSPELASDQHSVVSLTNRDLNNADTVAISPEQLAAETFDATVQMDFDIAKAANIKNSAQENVTSVEDLDLEETADLSDYSIEESTIAMDAEALSMARAPRKP